jgi:ABC-type transporter Mla subunit MlaD
VPAPRAARKTRKTTTRPRSRPAPKPASGDALEALRARLDEIPRAEDFQPLADHLYAFAQSAPALIESLKATRRAAERFEAAARSLSEVADTLVATHESWTESLLRLPRAEDYEPLVGPLREFARVSPALAETLGSVVRAVTPLPALLAATPPRDGSGDGASAALAAAASRMSAARAAIEEALASLPRDPSYASAAKQLRELATVSPSLMEWMRQLPVLSLPLGESIAALERAARELGDGAADLEGALKRG